MATFIAPDFSFPLTADETGELICLEQDTSQDFETKSELLIRYRPGMRSALPEFGSTGLLGRRASPDPDISELATDHAHWIPEANYRIGATLDPSDSSAWRVQIEVDAPSLEGPGVDV